MIICLVTGSYPYDVALEDTFLKDEVVIMSEMFTRAYIIPKNISSSCCDLPQSLKLDNELAIRFKKFKRLSIKTIFYALVNTFLSVDFYSEIIRKKLFLGQIKNLKWLVTYQIKRRLVGRYISEWIRKNNFSKEQVLFYTFWLDDATHGICDAIEPFSKNMKVISRAHGFDIYEERTYPPYWPLRPSWFDKLEAVFADSKAGRDYLAKKYPNYADKFHLSLMGVAESGFITSDSKDGVFRLVSCSMLTKLKRIDLIMTSLKRFSLAHPEISIEWTHFGNNTPELRISDLMNLKNNLGFDSNVKITFPGYGSQESLYDFYKSNCIDCFITVSESEGTPVSILEALNCGIPIIATAVGGIIDLVSSNNGYLLSPTPSDVEVSETLFKLYSIRNSKELHLMKQSSKHRWSLHYNSKVNYFNFFRNLKQILCRENTDYFSLSRHES